MKQKNPSVNLLIPAIISGKFDQTGCERTREVNRCGGWRVGDAESGGGRKESGHRQGLRDWDCRCPLSTRGRRGSGGLSRLRGWGKPATPKVRDMGPPGPAGAPSGRGGRPQGKGDGRCVVRQWAVRVGFISPTRCLLCDPPIVQCVNKANRRSGALLKERIQSGPRSGIRCRHLHTAKGLKGGMKGPIGLSGTINRIGL